MPTYSHSRLSSFEQCPYKYKLRYIDKIKPEIEKSIEAHLGTAVHDTLEWLYLQVKNQIIPSIDDTIIKYTENWKKDFSEKIVIVKKQLTAQNYFDKGIKFILDYYMQHRPFDDGTIELEKKIFIKLKPGTNIIGFIDRLVENLKTGEMEVHDYKTANFLPTQEKMDQDRQLALYSIAVKEQFGQDKEVQLIWHYLAHNKKITSTRTDKQLEQLKEDTIKLINKIEATTKFPTEKSILCDWCEFKTMCPEFGNAPTEKPESSELPEQIKEKYPTLSKYFKD